MFTSFSPGGKKIDAEPFRAAPRGLLDVAVVSKEIDGRTVIDWNCHWREICFSGLYTCQQDKLPCSRR